MRRFIRQISVYGSVVYIIGLVSLLVPFHKYHVPFWWQLPPLTVWFFFGPSTRKDVM